MSRYLAEKQENLEGAPNRLRLEIAARYQLVDGITKGVLAGPRRGHGGPRCGRHRRGASELRRVRPLRALPAPLLLS